MEAVYLKEARCINAKGVLYVSSERIPYNQLLDISFICLA